MSLSAETGPDLPALPVAELPPLREIIARHGLFATKALGQNFLFDEQLLTADRGDPRPVAGRAVLEVGPGPGGLTRALLRAGARVTAVEMDPRCLPALAEIARIYPGPAHDVHADALAFDPAPSSPRTGAIVANLPYNVGTALLTGWLDGEAWPPRWTPPP